mgnify:CR=1 FL=1
MNKNKFAGLAEAKMKALEVEEQGAEPEEPAAPVVPEVKKAVRQVNKQTSKQAGKSVTKASAPVKSEDAAVNLVGVTIKIPEEKRIWWNVQAKLQRTTITDAIVEALDARFGPPKL